MNTCSFKHTTSKYVCLRSSVPVIKTKCTVFPNTDRSWLVHNSFFFLLNSTKYFPADVKLTNSEKQGRDGGRRIEERCIILIDNNQT